MLHLSDKKCVSVSTPSFYQLFVSADFVLEGIDRLPYFTMDEVATEVGLPLLVTSTADAF